MKSKISKTIDKMILITLVCTFAFSTYYIIKHYYDREMPLREIKQVEKQVIKDDKFDWDAFKASVKINYRHLSWLKLDNGISLPVVQVYDNFSMLNTDIKGNYAITGTLFVDYKVDKPYEQPKTIIYGHNMHYGSSMFTSLLQYYKDSSYLENNKHGVIYTEDKEYKIEIVKVLKTVGTDSAVYDLQSREHMEDDARYVVLSTCWAYRSQERVVVYAKIVKETKRI